MANYKYVAKDIHSKVFRGKKEFPSREDLYAYLRDENLYLIKATEVEDHKKKPKMKLNELSTFCRELGTMLGSGISLIMTINIISKRNTNQRLNDIYKDLYIKLQQGYTLSSALEEHSETFPSLMINMLRASESSGLMDKVAIRLADQFEKDYKLENKVRSAMLYPMILVIVTIFVIIAVFTLILPQFFTAFEGNPLPLITEIMFVISRFMIQYWYWVIVLVLSIIAIVSLMMRVDSIRYKWDEFKIKCPKVSELTKVIYTARFARSFSSLYSSGVTMLNALSLAKSTINNSFIEAQFEKIIRDVRDGRSLSQAISDVEGFDPKLASSVFIGEESGALDDMLLNIANDFDYEAEVATERLVTLLQPLMIIIIGFIIGVVILAVMLPVYQLYGSIGAS